MTRSNVMSSIRQVDAPSTNVSPGRLSYTISSSSSPTRVPSGRNTPNRPRSGIVPPLRDRQPLRSVAGADRVVDAVPHDPRPQLGELLARVATGEQVEHVAEQLVGQFGKVGAPAHRGGQRRPPALAGGGDVGDDLLGQHVERVAQIARVLDLAVDHPPGHHRRLDEVAAMLGKDRAFAGLADRVAGPADPLQPTAHGTGRLDLDHEVDRAHVDPEFERRRGDDRPQLATLELIFDHHPLLAGERAVVGRTSSDLGRAARRPAVPRTAR